jgi:hypothetical protein
VGWAVRRALYGITMLSVAVELPLLYVTETGYVPSLVPLATVHVSGEVPALVQEIEPKLGVTVRVQVEEVVRS